MPELKDLEADEKFLREVKNHTWKIFLTAEREHAKAYSALEKKRFRRDVWMQGLGSGMGLEKQMYACPHGVFYDPTKGRAPCGACTEERRAHY